CARGIYYEAYW
nr:immunoglobulin heavy chain junction region [Mus musculus]